MKRKMTINKKKWDTVFPTNWNAELTGDENASVLVYTERFPGYPGSEMKKRFANVKKHFTKALRAVDPTSTITVKGNSITLTIHAPRKVRLMTLVGEFAAQAADDADELCFYMNAMRDELVKTYGTKEVSHVKKSV